MPKLPRPNFRRRKPEAPAESSSPATEAAAEPSAEPAVEPVAVEQHEGTESPAEQGTEQKVEQGTEQPVAAEPVAEAPTTPLPAIADLSTSSRRLRMPSPTPPSLWPDWSRRLLAVLAVLAIGGIGFAAGYLIEGDPEEATSPGPAPEIIIESTPQPETDEADRIGFPEFATRNTTRVGGADAIADGAGVALASYPSLGGVDGPQAVIVAPSDSWQEALAATPLTADPVAAPLLLSGPDEVPELTGEALAGLAPRGIDEAEGAQVIAVGDVAVPEGLERLDIAGADAAEVAKRVDAERARLTGEDHPDHIVVVSSEEADLAMPAAAWAARSGDPILFAAADEVPDATLRTVAKHKDTPVYVLGPESAISAKAIGKLEKKAAGVTRISNADDPVESSIEFARFIDGDFGWNINDPGHGFVIASAERPLDAAVAAPLSAGGKPGPLLVTTDGQTVPAALQGFLTDTQPGFVDDPSRAVYNHVWILGSTDAISVQFQAQVDELTKLAPVSAGTSGTEFGPVPGTPEDEPEAGGDEADTGGGSDDAKQPKDDSGDTR